MPVRGLGHPQRSPARGFLGAGPSPRQPAEIFAGVTYGCERLPVTQEGGGLVHWVRVDLTAPGVELYVTPLDPSAVARGWQYRLRPIEDVVEREHLAVAVNGTYFATASGSSLRFSGDLARSMQTLVSDHVIAYGPWGASLLWFDAELVPHVLQSSSAAEPDLVRAKWAVGYHTSCSYTTGRFCGLATLRPTPEPRLESIRQESFCSWRLESASRSPACCTSWPTLGPRRDFCSTEEARAQWRLDRAAPAFQPPYCWEAAVPWLPT